MKSCRIALLFFLTTAALLPACGSHTLEDAGWERRELAPGVKFLQRHFEDLYGAPQFVNILQVDLDAPGTEIRFAAARHLGVRGLPVPAFAEGSGAIAAVNGGFAHGGRHSTNSGIFKIDGEVLPFLREEPEELRFVGGAALGIDDAGNWHFINRPGNSWPEDWPEVRHALAGGHRLIEGGEIHPSIRQLESAREVRHGAGKHPRTAIGLLPDRTALLLTVDGRHDGKSVGLTLEELARFMLDLGCTEALNLDGGGSTTMWLREEGIVNHPSDNQAFDQKGARRVRSAVLVFYSDDTLAGQE